MKCRNGNSLALWVAIAALPLVAASAFGQVQVSTGHSNDANNRVGSSGSNDAVITPPSIVNGATGVGGQPLPFSDPMVNRGPVAVDEFIRNAYGRPTAVNPIASPLYTGAKPFYPVSDGSTPLPPSTDTYAPNYASPNYEGIASNYGPSASPSLTPQPQDQRLGIDAGLTTDSLPKPGDLIVSSQVDPTASASPQTTYLAASPLYGVRDWQSANPLLANPASPNQPGTDQDRIAQMRRELIQSAQSDQQTGATPNNPNQPSDQTTGNGPLAPLMAGGTTTNLNKPLQPLQPTGLAALTPLSVTPLAGQVARLPNPSDLELPTPSQQSLKYAEMQQRLAQYNKTHPMTDEQRNHQFIADLQSRRLAEQNPQGAATPGQDQANPDLTAGNPQTGTPTATPNPTGTPGVPSAVTPSETPVATPAVPATPPVEISSLAEGIKSKGLATLLTDAEDQVRHQQFSKAIEDYDEASAVAPNNPLIPIGRANAELGGSYYQQAANDLRNAFLQDSTVMMAQYDLGKLLGDQRLKFIVTDLKQLASDSPENPTPVFLLAYVAYNTHHEDLAAGWLDVAEKRAGGTDEVIPLLKKYWTFTPTTQPSPK